MGMPLADLERTLTTKTRPATAAGVKAPGAEKSMVITLSPPAAPADQAAAAADDAPAAKADDTQLDDPDPDGNRPIRWAKLSDQVPESVYKDIEGLGIRGVYGSRVYRRDYPHNEMAAHVIGYVDREERPIAGMEHYADFYLRGENGWLESEKDGKSHELAQFRTREVPPSDGFSVSLTIDATIQRMVEDELKAIAEKYAPEKATIIVSDPRTGFILALGELPVLRPQHLQQALAATTSAGCATSRSRTSTSRARSSRSWPSPARSTRGS